MKNSITAEKSIKKKRTKKKRIEYFFESVKAKYPVAMPKNDAGIAIVK